MFDEMYTRIMSDLDYRSFLNLARKTGSLSDLQVSARMEFNKLIGTFSTFILLKYTKSRYSRDVILAAHLKSDFGLGAISDPDARARIQTEFGVTNIATTLPKETIAALSYLLDERGLSWSIFRKPTLNTIDIAGRREYSKTLMNLAS